MRNRTVKRVAAVVGLALLVQLLPAVGMPPAMASECASCSGNCGCPAPQPVLEAGFGQSLFWQDPCGGGYRNDFMPCYQHNSGAPTWFASAEFLPLFRDQAGSLPFQAVGIRQVEITPPVGTTNPIDPPDIVTYRRDVVLSSGDFDNEFEPGVRALFGRALGDWYRVEFAYIGSYSWADEAKVWYQNPNGVEGNMVSPLSNFGSPSGPADLGPVAEEDWDPDPNFDYNDFAAINFSSRLDSAEANVRRRLCVGSGRYYQGEASCLIGLRYLKVQEKFGYETNDNLASVETDNDLIGPQLGAMAQFLVHDRAWVDVEIKGALLLSEARSTRYTDLFGAEPETTRGSADSTAFLGDLSVNLNYQFAPSLTVRAGYNAFWLDGVALASENLNLGVQSAVSRPMAVNHDGRVVYHGPSLGIVYAR